LKQQAEILRVKAYTGDAAAVKAALDALTADITALEALAK
jgi:hypothetical protein